MKEIAHWVKLVSIKNRVRFFFFCVVYRGQVSYILRHRSYGVEGRSFKLMGECYTHDKIDRQVIEDLERD